MKTYNIFVSRALLHEGNMARLTDESHSKVTKLEQYKSIEDLAQKITADGVVSPKERTQLKHALEVAGLTSDSINLEPNKIVESIRAEIKQASQLINTQLAELQIRQNAVFS